MSTGCVISITSSPSACSPPSLRPPPARNISNLMSPPSRPPAPLIASLLPRKAPPSRGVLRRSPGLACSLRQRYCSGRLQGPLTEGPVLLHPQLMKEPRPLDVDVVPTQCLIPRHRPLHPPAVSECERQQSLLPRHFVALGQPVNGVATGPVQLIAWLQVPLGNGDELGHHPTLQIPGRPALNHGPRNRHGHLHASEVIRTEKTPVGTPLLCSAAESGLEQRTH